jgi:L-seryl-tRNA(Ser) seleniumtransferase
LSHRIDLSCLPSVDEVVRHESIVQLLADYPRPQLIRFVRDAIDVHRQLILQGHESEYSNDPAKLFHAVIDKLHELVSLEDRSGLQQVINATGILLHTNLGRAPLSEKAVSRIQEATAFTNLEMDLASGQRSRRGDRACRLLAELTGAEDAVVVNNCAAATMLVLQAISAGQEVIVSRGQLVEIGGGFRLPEVFTSAGVFLKEVGTTNRTYLRDYEQAIGEQTGAIIRVHRSNFSLSGFVTEPTIQELVTIQRPVEIPVIDDLGSGLVTKLSGFGIDEPRVQDSVAAGADLCLFSGDKLFGGPQCGIIVGRRKWTDRLRSCPLMRAMRTDKLTLAALEATTEIHLAGRLWSCCRSSKCCAKSLRRFETRVWHCESNWVRSGTARPSTPVFLRWGWVAAWAGDSEFRPERAARIDGNTRCEPATRPTSRPGKTVRRSVRT